MINDKDIRLELKEIIQDEDTLIVEELAIPKRICLADVVMLDKTRSHAMHGFEIKSEIDTLKRLPMQVEYYSRVFQYCTLIVAEKHEEKALAMIPDWWGVVVVVNTGFDEFGEDSGDFVLLETRQPMKNPVERQPYALLQLLWRSELLNLIDRHQLDVDKKLKKRPLRERIAKQLTSEMLEEEVIAFLLEREDWKIPGVESAYFKKRREERTKRASKRKYRKRFPK
ncbi:hypothetical protein JMA_43260 (plasmid) [Jeotgalibacillus malaysiensis]|uniref:Sce7726 family protein n=1 Tax=Jeotgalibacillus malaysiensis TaxID=1508404 RepID=A0A0B5AYP9_9BACL|nr:sce7726 family protein [Jeotgalibacillus malaysiensis]AJD93643.1 hypothetical protein JMA_43260 [Jeotgalibacillus malaysiensis]